MSAKVLIIEDDQLIQRMYEKIFKFQKFDVTIAGDGEKGLEIAKSLKPTIILLDVMMPKMDGFEVLKKLKEYDETKKIPVVMLSNLAGENDVETALSKGAVKYIVKSEHDPKEVSDIVQEIIDGYTRNKVPSS